MRRARASVRAVAAAAGLAAMCAAADAAWGQGNAPVQGNALVQDPGPNYSSHDAAFFESLLAGRVWVLERPNSSRADDRGTVWAHYHAPDGTLLACAHLGGAYAAATARWRVVPSRSFRALYNYLEPGAEPDPARRRGHTPLFHDPETGALHNETLSGTNWRIASRGWVQESWPRAMKTACPGLAVPAGLPVNERQISTAFGTMMAQDPEAPVRNAPGSHLRGPGATGIAAAQGRPRLPAAELARFLEENDGFVLTDTAGARHVLVLGAESDELWLLGEDGGIADTGVLVPSSDGMEIAVHYRRLPIRPRYRIGDALPFLPTGKRFAAMRMTDRLASEGTPVALPFAGTGVSGTSASGTGVSGTSVSGGGETVLRLRPDGGVTAGGGGTETVPGTWRWSRGELVVTLEASGGPETEARYPWRLLADLWGPVIR